MKNVKNIVFSSFMLLVLTAQVHGMEESATASTSAQTTPVASQQNLINYLFNAIQNGNADEIRDAIARDKNIVNIKNHLNITPWELVQHHITYENWPYIRASGRKTECALEIIRILEEAGTNKPAGQPAVKQYRSVKHYPYLCARSLDIHLRQFEQEPQQQNQSHSSRNHQNHSIDS